MSTKKYENTIILPSLNTKIQTLSLNSRYDERYMEKMNDFDKIIKDTNHVIKIVNKRKNCKENIKDSKLKISLSSLINSMKEKDHKIRLRNPSKNNINLLSKNNSLDVIKINPKKINSEDKKHNNSNRIRKNHIYSNETEKSNNLYYKYENIYNNNCSCKCINNYSIQNRSIYKNKISIHINEKLKKPMKLKLLNKNNYYAEKYTNIELLLKQKQNELINNKNYCINRYLKHVNIKENASNKNYKFKSLFENSIKKLSFNYKNISFSVHDISII